MRLNLILFMIVLSRFNLAFGGSPHNGFSDNNAAELLKNSSHRESHALILSSNGERILTKNFPESFTCVPERFYSGGYKIFYIKRTTENFTGYEYWQKTSGHGLIFDSPQLIGIIELQVTITDDKIEFLGFHDWGNIVQPLVLPLLWPENGLVSGIKNELFYNDLYADGRCSLGKIF